MKYVSVCSGIEAATVAWHPLGWKPVAFSEIEPFPCAVLKHHYPDVPNLGDMTQSDQWEIENGVDALVGGTPCQSFSLAGNRGGMDDPRGQLAVKFFDIVRKCKPTWIVWENVPGVLSSNKGRDFGLFLSEMGKCGYGFAYRILDAQYFGVPQRRRRVFVVGHLGDWRPSAAVLFERQSLCGNLAKSGKTREDIAKCLTRGASQRCDAETETMIPVLVPNDSKIGCLDSERGASKITHQTCANGHLLPVVCKSFTVADARRRGTIDLHDTVQTLTSQTNGGDTEPCVVIGCKQTADCLTASYATKWNGNASATNGSLFAIAGNNISWLAVRRLTPRECERLQGFPDNYTAIPWRGKSAELCPDGPRYKALGNSMAVPVMRWIGERIEMVSKVIKK